VHHEEEHDNHERWLLTYADLITLLLALFMMLYAMSVLDLKKYEAFQEAFTQGMGKHVHALPGEGDPPNGEKLDTKPGALTGKPDPSPSPVSDQLKPVLDQEELRKLKQKLDHEIGLTGLQDEVQVDLERRGLVINMVSGVLFDSGSAQLTTRGTKLLGALGVVFRSFQNELVVEGHTDSRPIRTASFPSNWELSTARATSVLQFLLSGDQISARRLSAAGYADTRPRAANTTEAGMARNRRVDVVVLAGPSKPAAVTPRVTATPSVPRPTGSPEVRAAARH
jgi:chemotaxis protein MotB